MADDLRVRHLVEEILEAQRTPEQVCSDTPELLPAVRKRLEQVQRVNQQLDEIFSDDDPTKFGESSALKKEIELPVISGYEVESVLGRGGMGVVFKARQQSLNRPVALKMLLAGAYAGPEELVRFRREAEAVAALKHPNIVQVHDAGEVAGHPYFAMEYVEAGTLAGRLATNPLESRGAAELIATLASAVQFAHQCGFIHRDLKPVNILLTPDGTPKIADFGLARCIHGDRELTLSGARLGTPTYMAPEQASGHVGAVGPAADIYALGAVLYEMLTGKPPLEGQTPTETIQKVIADEPTPPSRLNAKVPRDLETICLKCLQKNAARRYASAQDLADDLHRYLDGKPVLARPVGVLERVAKWMRRRPGLATLLAALIAFLVVASLAGMLFWEQTIIRRTEEKIRRERARPAVEAAIRQAYEAARAERWGDADRIFESVELPLKDADSEELRKRVAQAKNDVQFTRTLEFIRQQTLISDLEKPAAAVIDYAVMAEEFSKVFALSRFKVDAPAHEAAQRIRESPLAAHTIAALDEWAFAAYRSKRGPKHEHLLLIAKLADPDPWRDLFRDATWNDPKSVRYLAEHTLRDRAAAGHQLAIVGKLLKPFSDKNMLLPLLRPAWDINPVDFCLNWELACVFTDDGYHDKALPCYRAALTMRPNSPWIHHRLATALFLSGKFEDGIQQYRKILSRWPKDRMARHSLALALQQRNRCDEATKLCQQAIDADPKDAWPQISLGVILALEQNHEEAVNHFIKANELHASCVASHYQRGATLKQSGQLQEAFAAFREGAALERGAMQRRLALSQSLSSLARYEEAILEFKLLIQELETPSVPGDFNPRADSTPVKVVLAEALLAAGSFAEASAMATRILDLKSLRGQDRSAMERVLKISKGLAPLAAELPLFVEGKKRPEPATHLVLAEWLHYYKRSTAAAVKWYELALANPANSRLGQTRFNASCAAAQAGCGFGSDARKLTDKEKLAHRQKAREWLITEYAMNFQPKKLLDTREIVGAWFRHPDLACVRDELALAKLSPQERHDWRMFWYHIRNLKSGPAPPPKLFKADQDAARAFINQCHWAKAAAAYAKLLKDSPTLDGEIWYEFAAVQLLSGDADGYRETCKTMLKAAEEDKMRRYLAARACTLAADPRVDVVLASQLSDEELQRSAKEFWSLTEQGALHYRSKRYKEAIPLLEASLRARPAVGAAVLNWLWLAMAHHQLGETNEGRAYLQKAAAWLDSLGMYFPIPTADALSLHRHSWLEAHVLRREVEALLSKNKDSR